MSENLVDIQNLRFGWPGQSPVLDIPAWQVAPGERVFLQGASGSGKSTLLGLLSGVHQPVSGHLMVDGVQLSGLKGASLDRFRADHLGYIFQSFNLLPYLSVVENVTLPCHFSRARRERLKSLGLNARREGMRLLSALKLPDSVFDRSVTGLSIGQQQRVAVARALIGRPPLVLADEPTSALDAATRGRFLELLFRELEAAQSTLIFVSHDDGLRQFFDRHDSLADLNRIHPEMAEEL